MTGDGSSGDLKFYFRLEKDAKFSQEADIEMNGIIFSGRPLLFQIFDDEITNLKTYMLVQELQYKRTVISFGPNRNIDKVTDAGTPSPIPKVVKQRFEEFLSPDPAC